MSVTPCNTKHLQQNAEPTASTSAAESDAVEGDSADLAVVVAAWPTLPAATRAEIVALVQAVHGDAR